MNRKTSVFLLIFVFLAFHPLSAAISETASLHTRPAMNGFLSTLGPQGLSDLSKNLAEKNPGASLTLLRRIHAAQDPKSFAEIVRIMCARPDFFKRFIDAGVNNTTVEGFAQISLYLAEYPEVIRTNVLMSIDGLTDDELVEINRISARHPEALKKFAVLQDDAVLASFGKKTFEDQKTLALVIQNIKKNPQAIAHYYQEWNMRGISKDIVSHLDKSFYKNLLVPDDSNADILLLGLSLTDGIIDPRGQEKISLPGVDRQALKMIDSPKLILSFLWNYYFGDRSSQVALRFRKELNRADAADGKQDKVVDLRALFKNNPGAFHDLKVQWSAFIDAAHFREQLSDPDLLLEPTTTFIQNYDAEIVAKTLSPLYIRALDIEPKLSKISIEAMPPATLGKILQKVVGFMATSAEGKALLRQLNVSTWRDMKPDDLKRHMLEVNKQDPRAGYDLVMPVMLELQPQAMAKLTLTFAKNEVVLYGYNKVALEYLPVSGIAPIAQAVAKNPQDYFWAANQVIHQLPEPAQDAFLERLSRDPAALQAMSTMTRSLDEAFAKSLAQRFIHEPTNLRSIRAGLPASITQSVQQGLGL